MPRPVVPICLAPRRSSRVRSSAPCDGRINAALSATRSVSGEIVSPFSRMISISAMRAQGSTTTPLPMIDSLPGRTTPEGNRLSLYSTLLMTRVWPALCPPWKRTTTSARSDSQSTILPLPSSPHCAPITATLPISVSSPLPIVARRRDWFRLALLQKIGAAQPARFRHPIPRGSKRRDGDPALPAQFAQATPIGAERHQHPSMRLRLRQGTQDRIGVQGKPGRRFRQRGIAGLVAAAAAQFADRSMLGIDAGEKREADAGVVFEAAVLDRI